MNNRSDSNLPDVTSFDAAIKRAATSANNFCYGLITSWSIFELMKNEKQIVAHATREEMKYAQVEIDAAWQRLAAYHVGEA